MFRRRNSDQDFHADNDFLNKDATAAREKMWDGVKRRLVDHINRTQRQQITVGELDRHTSMSSHILQGNYCRFITRWGNFNVSVDSAGITQD